ncbi:MAG: hypothetical protein CMP10_05110 [Zetaproteobacteria bacterium]|mgnify:CR=1 FL=1|nr:hypothetical protein [Pseudobdellovibrionaceae bacterium]
MIKIILAITLLLSEGCQKKQFIDVRDTTEGQSEDISIIPETNAVLNDEQIIELLKTIKIQDTMESMDPKVAELFKRGGDFDLEEFESGGVVSKIYTFSKVKDDLVTDIYFLRFTFENEFITRIYDGLTDETIEE